jgi:hypothetical protein
MREIVLLFSGSSICFLGQSPAQLIAGKAIDTARKRARPKGHVSEYLALILDRTPAHQLAIRARETFIFAHLLQRHWYFASSGCAV